MIENDSENIDEFVEINSFMKDKKFIDVFDYNTVKDKGSVDASNKDNKYWRGINRVSTVLTMICSERTAYVDMKLNNCRSLFASAFQNPQDNDLDHNEQTTNDEI